MEELIFFGVIILFSILESVARKRKAQRRAEQAGERREVPSPREGKQEWEFEWATDDDDDLPTYDADPSYDDRAQGGATRPSSSHAPARPSSETMLPTDLFEELAGLAGRLEHERAAQRAQTIELPKQSPPLPTRSTSIPSGTSSVPARGGSQLPSPVMFGAPEHQVHRSHVGYGTDPSSRAPSEQDGLDPLAAELGTDARAVRRLLARHSGAALRQAVILQEVLGPPSSMRVDPLSPEWGAPTSRRAPSS